MSATSNTAQHPQRLPTTQRTGFLNGLQHRRRYGRTFQSHNIHNNISTSHNNNHHYNSRNGNMHAQNNSTNHSNNSNPNVNNSKHNLNSNTHNNNKNNNNSNNNNKNNTSSINSNSTSFYHRGHFEIDKFNKGCPWRPVGFLYGRGVVGFHEEIEQFYNYILPTPTEYEIRNEVIQRIESVVHDIWPSAIVEVFGSFRTGLFLPTSDIDLVVLGLWEKPPLRTLETELIAKGVANPETVRVLDKAVVPLIKLTSREFHVKVDISFNIQSGVQCAEMIKLYKQEYPLMPKLVMVLKQFLMQRDLNEVFTGGISSYSLIIMCISFFQLHPRQIKIESANLGVLLLEFFELYGRKFNYPQVGISIRNGGSYITKEKIQSDIDALRASYLCIEDPLTVGNDIGRGSYRALQMKQAFEFAYLTLTQCLCPYSMWNVDCTERSILGRIINIADEITEYRDWIRCNFEHLVIKNNETSVQSVLQISSSNTLLKKSSNSRQFVHTVKSNNRQPMVSASASAISVVSLPPSPVESSMSLDSAGSSISSAASSSCFRKIDGRNRDHDKKREKRNKALNVN